MDSLISSGKVCTPFLILVAMSELWINDTSTKGFSRSYKNLYFYWILGASHFVSADQPYVSLQIVGNVTGSPN
ncbi:hypothetical protein SLE2022_078330 [Rubroshorea leprosula]